MNSFEQRITQLTASCFYFYMSFFTERGYISENKEVTLLQVIPTMTFQSDKMFAMYCNIMSTLFLEHSAACQM